MFVGIQDLVRSLPDIPDVLAKLKSGEYTLWGGVVRHASGTSKGGQIVGHLLFPGDAPQTQQSLQHLQSTLESGLNSLHGGIDHIQQSMNVLQGLQTANLVMSGLNLAVTAAGFVVVCQKLNKISAQIQSQSQGIAQTLQLVGEVYERSLLHDEARFRALLLSSQQFCEEGDVEHLKARIPDFHTEYQFTKLVLERHATIAASNFDRLGEITLLQDRLVNLGLMLSHVQMRIGAAKHGRDCLLQLEDDIRTFNTKRVEILASDRDLASRVTSTQVADLTTFLQNGKNMRPALTYQADVIDLEARYPGLFQEIGKSDDILLIAA